jgi:hypothetical protein
MKNAIIVPMFDLKERKLENLNVVIVPMFGLKPKQMENFNVALFRQWRKVVCVTPLCDADVMRKSVLKEIVERDAQVDAAVVKLNQAVVAQQVTFRWNCSA